MTRQLLLILAPLALAACSQEPAEQETADDFAARIGGETGAQTAAERAADPAQPSMDMPNKAKADVPEGADVTKLQQLGDIAGVNLGPREGACTFMAGETEMIIAAGMRDRAMGGKGVIRVGDALVLLDSGPGGIEAIKRGTTFRGEGVEVAVRAGGGAGQTRPAQVTVTAADGKSQNYSGNWICA